MDPFLISSIIGASGNVLGNGANVLMQYMQNRHNLHLVREQNAAAREEADKAYERSKPTTQVTNMRQVGMSQAGAVNALNGGGSYTPAPVNASQGEAPQIDLSGLSNVLLASEQLKEQKRNSISQLEEQKRQFDKNLAFEREKWNEEKIDKGYDRVIKQLQSQILFSEDAIKNLEYLHKLSTHDGEINAQNAENIARKSEAILTDLRSKKVVKAMANMTDEELDNLFELQATLNMLQQGLQYDSTGALIKGAKKLMSLFGASKDLGNNIRMH